MTSLARTAVPSSSNVPTVGSTVIFTLSSVSPSASMNPNSLATNVWVSPALTVTLLLVAVGAVLVTDAACVVLALVASAVLSEPSPSV